MAIEVRLLNPSDKPAWEPLWQGYLTFYKSSVPPEVTDLTWSRFHDPVEPMQAYGAFDGPELVGIVHIISHRSCWTSGDYCYLQDLFTRQDQRGKGVGRALIETVYAKAKEAGASRVHWLTHETNQTAMQLYDTIAERSGFIQYRKIL
jgi:GNAT superfamily N-acetyltransferase